MGKTPSHLRGPSPDRGGKATICSKCGKPIPPGRIACPCRPDPCGHVWDFRGLDKETDGKKYFRYRCLRCGEERVEPVSNVRDMYTGRLDAGMDG